MAKCSTPYGIPHQWSAPLSLITPEGQEKRWVKTCYQCGAILVEPFMEIGNTELLSRGTNSLHGYVAFLPRRDDDERMEMMVRLPSGRAYRKITKIAFNTPEWAILSGISRMASMMSKECQLVEDSDDRR